MQKATYGDMCQAFSDAFKALHGVRPPSWYSAKWSIDQLGEQTLKLYALLDDEAQRERDEQDRAINVCMDCGAPDIATAMRWLEQAYGDMGWEYV
jgi:hypothetical protein